MKTYDTIVIGGGPAGLAAAKSACKKGSVAILEREKSLGGILKQCIHDGFGLDYFKEKLTGPEYAQRFIDLVAESEIDIFTTTFVTKITNKTIVHENPLFDVETSSPNGMTRLKSKSLIFATGCRERTARQIAIHGTRPQGILTAGTAQHFVNLVGGHIGKKVVILGSGDIGLIMARRLTLEGAKVLGVFEAKSTPSGLSRNISQCLNDFEIPLHLSKTVTKVFGEKRVESVEIASVDQNMKVIDGTKERLECDALVLSVGLIPECELLETLGVKIDKFTKGASVDTNFMTTTAGVFACGNNVFVSDLADYVSKSGEKAGEKAMESVKNVQSTIEIKLGENLQCFAPQRISPETISDSATFYIRCKKNLAKSKFNVIIDGEVKFTKTFMSMKPPEMETISLNFEKLGLKPQSEITFSIKEVN